MEKKEEKNSRKYWTEKWTIELPDITIITAWWAIDSIIIRWCILLHRWSHIGRNSSIWWRSYDDLRYIIWSHYYTIVRCRHFLFQIIMSRQHCIIIPKNQSWLLFYIKTLDKSYCPSRDRTGTIPIVWWK